MTAWGRNGFWQDVVGRLEQQEAPMQSRLMRFEDGSWISPSEPGREAPEGLLQGRLLVADVSDHWIRLYPLGLAGRSRLQLRFILADGSNTGDPARIRYGVGVVSLEGAGWRIDVRVSPTLPVLEAVLVRGTEIGGQLSWNSVEFHPILDDEFTFPRSFDQDPVIERNNSTAPDPLPLSASAPAGVLVRRRPGRLVVAVEEDVALAGLAADRWEQERQTELDYWDRISSTCEFSVPNGTIDRQLRYSLHNSLFSRSVDEEGRTIFVHGRRDRGYADAAHLHQSYQMYLPALLAGEGASVRDELLAFCSLQDATGWIELAPRPVRGTSRYVGRYTNSHLLLAAGRYLDWTDDAEFFGTPVRGAVDGLDDTVAERIDRAARDLLAHLHLGLAEPCGWADAWNPDVRAQGQASAAAVMGLRAWSRASRWLGRDDGATEFAAAAAAMAECMRRELYDSATGLIAEHVFDGRLEGGTEDDFYSHTQIWSALANVVDDGRGLDLVAEHCLNHGVSIAPESAFDKEYLAASTDSTDSLPIESTATWLLASWPEVTHLYALAELDRHRPDDALAAVIQQLPETLHGLDPVCMPFFYAEKYLFPGTRPWLCTWAGDPSLIEVIITGFFGVQPDQHGLEVRPRIPSTWRGSQMSARFVWRSSVVLLELTPDLPAGVAEVNGAEVPAPVRIAPAEGSLHVRMSSLS